MQIELKDLIKPKFEVGQTVYIRHDGNKNNVRKGVIAGWHMSMKADERGVHEPVFQFYVNNIHGTSFSAGNIFLTAAEAFDE